MKTILSSGHGLKVSGASCFIDEVKEARKVVDRTKAIADIIKAKEVSIFHENTATNKTTNVNNIIAHHNKQTRALDCSIHFNSATFNGASKVDYGVGIEVLYATNSGKPHAQALADKLAKATGLKNRGAKLRTNLAFLNKTNKPAILIEVCFVNSKEDVDLYNKNFEGLCIALAEYLTGGKYNPPQPVWTNGSFTGNKAIVTADILNVRKARGVDNPVLGTLKKGDIVQLSYCLNKWISIPYKGGVDGMGYIHTDFIQLIK